MSEETQQQDEEQRDTDGGANGEGGGDDKNDAAQKAQEAEEKYEKAEEKMKELEENPPEKLEDWPDDAAKYQTFGGSEDGEAVYDEKHEEALGEHSVRHHEDGKVEVKGEEADNPDEYKGEPIPGGPTDPETPTVSGERDLSDEGSENGDSGEDDSDEKDRPKDSDPDDAT